MATRTITYTLCDGCFRDTFCDGIEIAQTRARRPHIDNDTQTIDLCIVCVDAEKYYCRLCGTVHSDANPCAAQLREI
jgi:hypothetical protein